MPRPTKRHSSLRSAILCAAVALVLPATTLRAADDGVAFAENVVVGETELSLRGIGNVRYMLVFEVYVGALYLPEETSAERILSADVPRRLVFEYLYEVRADQLIEAADHFLSENVGPAVLERIRPAVDAINRMYVDVSPGDRYALTYVPGVGTELALNGETVGVVPGAEFAENYFSIWLGEKPLSVRFKRQLLAPAAGGS